MKRVFAVFAAVVMLFSATACGDSDSESETAKGSSAGGPDGTYRYADIDGFGYLEDGPIRNYAVFDDGRFESFFCDDNTYSDKDFYKKYGYVWKTTGTYEVSDGIISSKFDDLNTKEDLFKMFPSCIEEYESLDDSEKEAFIEEQIKYHKVYFKDAEANEKMAIDKEKNIAYQIDKPHYWRQAAYNNLTGSIFTAFIYDFNAHIAQSDSYAADKYYIFSSVDEFNNNVSNEERKYLEDLLNKIDVPDRGWYTAEEGFTSNFDISKYNWIYVTKGTEYVTFALSEDVDSDLFGCYTVKDNYDSIRELYNYYKALSNN